MIGRQAGRQAGLNHSKHQSRLIQAAIILYCICSVTHVSDFGCMGFYLLFTDIIGVSSPIL